MNVGGNATKQHLPVLVIPEEAGIRQKDHQRASVAVTPAPRCDSAGQWTIVPTSGLTFNR